MADISQLTAGVAAKAVKNARVKPVVTEEVSEAAEKVNETFQKTPEPEQKAEKAPSRPPLRPELRDDPVARARQRAAQVREHLGDGGMADEADRFQINPNEIPEGWSYEWKRKVVFGKEDPAYEVELARKGWEPVPLSRHPHMMPPNSPAQYIERDGMLLMERPKELTDEARDVELRKARAQVRQKEEQLSQAPEGTMTRDHAKARPQIRKGYEPMPIPKE